MRRAQLGIGGPEISVLGIGALHFGAFVDQPTASQLIDCALDLGINFFETAPLYGNGESEAILGRALGRRRAAAIVSTKVGLAPDRRADGAFAVQPEPLRAADIVASVERSLRALGTDHIDLLQLHVFDPTTPPEATIQALADLIQAGKIRWWGGSNYDEHELAAMLAARSGPPPVSLQCHFNMIERRAQDELIPLARKNGLGVLCNRGLARGILSGKYRPGAPFPPGSRGLLSARVRESITDPMVRLVADLGQAAAGFGVEVIDLAIGWLLQQGGVTSIVLGVRDVAQLERCARAASFAPSPTLLAQVEKIIESHHLQTRVRAMPETFFER